MIRLDDGYDSRDGYIDNDSYYNDRLMIMMIIIVKYLSFTCFL